MRDSSFGQLRPPPLLGPPGARPAGPPPGGAGDSPVPPRPESEPACSTCSLGRRQVGGQRSRESHELLAGGWGVTSTEAPVTPCTAEGFGGLTQLLRPTQDPRRGSSRLGGEARVQQRLAGEASVQGAGASPPLSAPLSAPLDRVPSFSLSPSESSPSSLCPSLCLRSYCPLLGLWLSLGCSAGLSPAVCVPTSVTSGMRQEHGRGRAWERGQEGWLGRGSRARP